MLKMERTILMAVIVALLALPVVFIVAVAATSRLSGADLLHYGLLSLLFTALFAVLLLMGGMEILERWVESDLAKRKSRTYAMVERLRELKEQHPELVLLSELTALVGEEKAEAENRRSFWAGILVNLFFTLLGFALSYTATKLGWLR